MNDHARIIAAHYGITRRAITPQEVAAEIASLARKESRGSLDDMDERLYVALGLGEVA